VTPVPTRTTSSGVYVDAWDVAALRTVFFAQHEPDTSHGVQKFSLELPIELPTEADDLRIDDIIERGLPGGLFPDVPRQHLPRDHPALAGKKIFEELEFASSEFNRLAAACDGPLRHVHFEIRQTESLARVRLAPS